MPSSSIQELLKKAATAQQVERLRDATARRLAEKAKKKRAEAAAEAARATREVFTLLVIFELCFSFCYSHYAYILFLASVSLTL